LAVNVTTLPQEVSLVKIVRENDDKQSLVALKTGESIENKDILLTFLGVDSETSTLKFKHFNKAANQSKDLDISLAYWSSYEHFNHF
jgi:hypothetical protein